MGRLLDRLAMLRGIVDEDNPVAFVAIALLTQVGLVRDDGSQRAFRESITSGWVQAVSGTLTEQEWRRKGQELDQELADDERRWQSQIDQAIEIERETRRREGMYEGFEYPRRRGYEIIRRGLAIPSHAPWRIDACASYLAQKFNNALRARPGRNDWHDSRHLQHLLWPAFLVTTDFGLIEAVDQTGIWQRAWVRTPFELVHERIARCEPWGKPARTVARRFQRLPNLRERQELWRAGLNSTTATA